MYYKITDVSGWELATGYNATSIKELGEAFLSLQQDQYSYSDEARFRKAILYNNEAEIRMFIESQFFIEESEQPFEELKH